MADIIDYLLWRGDLTFSQSPLNPADALIFSAFSYIGLQGIAPETAEKSVKLSELAQVFEELPEEEQELRLRNDRDRELLRRMGESRRFGELEVTAARNVLDEKRELQFAAVTLLTGNGGAVLVFRGTDRTLTGWKEDFNLSFMDTIPGQWTARDYLEETARACRGELWTAGHSKGGNLAVFAAAACSGRTQDRIHAVYNMDGPGFSRAVLENEGYRKMVGRIHTFVPESSVVGMLLEHEEPYTVVKSSKMGIMQHEPYSWEVLGADFIRLEQVSESSRMLDKTVKNWLRELSREERERFIDEIYDILQASDAKRLKELAQPANLYAVLQKFGRTDAGTKQMMIEVLARLVKTAAGTIREDRGEEI